MIQVSGFLSFWLDTILGYRDYAELGHHRKNLISMPLSAIFTSGVFYSPRVQWLIKRSKGAASLLWDEFFRNNSIIVKEINQSCPPLWSLPTYLLGSWWFYLLVLTVCRLLSFRSLCPLYCFRLWRIASLTPHGFGGSGCVNEACHAAISILFSKV